MIGLAYEIAKALLAESTPQEKLENSITGDRWLRDAPPVTPAAPKAEKLEGNPWGKKFPFGAGGKNDD